MMSQAPGRIHRQNESSAPASRPASGIFQGSALGEITMASKGGRILSVLVACLAIATAAAAQESINQGTISGRVLDPQGAAAPGALVTVRQTDTGVTIEATTDSNGRFRFPYLRIGPYELRAKLEGFKEHARTLALSAGSAFDLSITLDVGGIDAAVTVVADTLALETARSQIVGTVPQAEVQNLPMNGRNFLDLALARARRVADEHQQHAAVCRDLRGARPGTLDRQPAQSVEQLHRGRLSANDDAAGLSGIPFGVDAIEQFQVVTGGGQAELGRALGGYVNVVTRSGTNTLHGTFYSFFRDDAFNGKNALTRTTLPMDQQQFGGSLGGPSARATGRSTSRTSSASSSIRPASSPSCPRTCRSSTRGCRRPATRDMPVATGIYPNPVHSTNVLGKIDHQLSGADQLSVRYALYDVLSEQCSRRRSVERAVGLDRTRQPRSVDRRQGMSWTLSPNTVNETRVQVGPRRSQGLFDRSDRTAGEHLRRGDVRHVLQQSDAAREHDVPGRQQPIASSWRSRASRRRRFPVQR